MKSYQGLRSIANRKNRAAALDDAGVNNSTNAVILAALQHERFADGSKGKGKAALKAFLVACLEVLVLAVIGRIVLDRVQEPVDRAFTTPYTRVGD